MKKKKCGRCNQLLDESAFSVDSTNVDGLRWACRECHNRERSEWAKRRRISNKQILDSARNRGCQMCGESEKVCLDFHHIEPQDRAFRLGSLKLRSPVLIQAEIEKCIVLCANCHRKADAGLIPKETLMEIKEQE